MATWRLMTGATTANLNLTLLDLTNLPSQPEQPKLISHTHTLSLSLSTLLAKFRVSIVCATGILASEGRNSILSVETPKAGVRCWCSFLCRSYESHTHPAPTSLSPFSTLLRSAREGLVDLLGGHLNFPRKIIIIRYYRPRLYNRSL